MTSATDKYCPLRFREFGSQLYDQLCVGECCAWFWKCSQHVSQDAADCSEHDCATCAAKVELQAKVDYLQRKYDLVCKGIVDVVRNYVDEGDEGLA